MRVKKMAIIDAREMFEMNEVRMALGKKILKRVDTVKGYNDLYNGEYQRLMSAVNVKEVQQTAAIVVKKPHPIMLAVIIGGAVGVGVAIGQKNHQAIQQAQDDFAYTAKDVQNKAANAVQNITTLTEEPHAD